MQIRVRTRNDVDAYQFAFDGFDGLRAGVGGGFDGGNIAHDTRGDEGIAYLGHGTGEFDIRGLEHGVRPLDEGYESAGFNHSYGL